MDEEEDDEDYADDDEEISSSSCTEAVCRELYISRRLFYVLFSYHEVRSLFVVCCFFTILLHHDTVQYFIHVFQLREGGKREREREREKRKKD